jgi:hypothetical protein
MASRNTALLARIVDVLSDLVSNREEALSQLEAAFNHALLTEAATVEEVARHAETLRLAITTEECALVLDHLASTAAATIGIETVDEAINTLFPDRFIEP